MDELAELARRHGCPAGCPACAQARAAASRVHRQVTDPVFVAFVQSRAAIRATMHSRRTGRPFPVFTDDDVIQFCIEEACFERAETADNYSKLLAAEGANTDQLSQVPVEDQAAVSDALGRAREFARTGVAPDPGI